MAYIDYDFYARAYRLEGRALTSSEIAPILADVATFTAPELWATFKKFGLPFTKSAPKSRLCEALGECLRIAPVFAPDGKIIAPRLAYDCQTKAFRVSRIPLVRLDGDRAAPGPRFRANSVSAPVGRDGSAQHRKKAANDETDA